MNGAPTTVPPSGTTRAIAWRRLGAFLAWSADPREDGSVAFEPPDGGKQVVVAPDLCAVE